DGLPEHPRRGQFHVKLIRVLLGAPRRLVLNLKERLKGQLDHARFAGRERPSLYRRTAVHCVSDEPIARTLTPKAWPFPSCLTDMPRPGARSFGQSNSIESTVSGCAARI